MIDVDAINFTVLPEPREKPLSESVPADVYTAVWQAVGAASMCWAETPTSIFDTTRAEAVAVNLLHVIAAGFDRTTGKAD